MTMGWVKNPNSILIEPRINTNSIKMEEMIIETKFIFLMMKMSM